MSYSMGPPTRSQPPLLPTSSLAAGVCVVQGLLYPLDTIRTRLAVSPTNTYNGILHAAYRIRRDEGVAAFYRGLTPSMIGILPFAGVDIALFEVGARGGRGQDRGGDGGLGGGLQVEKEGAMEAEGRAGDWEREFRE